MRVHPMICSAASKTTPEREKSQLIWTYDELSRARSGHRYGFSSLSLMVTVHLHTLGLLADLSVRHLACGVQRILESVQIPKLGISYAHQPSRVSHASL